MVHDTTCRRVAARQGVARCAKIGRLLRTHERGGLLWSGDNLRASTDSKRVLVVDDDLSVRELLGEYLRGRGHSVDTADSGEEAVRRLPAQDFDVVIADLKMPGVGGLEVLRAARGLERVPAFILISGYATLDSAISCLQEGAHDYLLKPFRLSDLHESMLRAVARAHGPREGTGLDGALALQQMADRADGPEDWRALFERVVEMTRESTFAEVCALMYFEEEAGEWNTVAMDASQPDAMSVLARVNPDALHRRVDEEGAFATNDVAGLYFGEGAPAGGVAAAPVRVMRIRGATTIVAMVVAATVGKVSTSATAALEIYAAVLGNALTRRFLSSRLQELHGQNLAGLASLIELKDRALRTHTERVANYARAVVEHMGVDEATADAVMWGARLHDVGKVGVSLELLYKKEKLTDEEFGRLKDHAWMGQRILEKVEVDGVIRDCILFHHERWDGNGYPNGLAGEDIPLGARVLTVCDAYDAITGRRVYVQNCSHAHAIEELQRGAGKQFDPAIVEAFLVAVQAFLRDGEPVLDVEIPEE